MTPRRRANPSWRPSESVAEFTKHKQTEDPDPRNLPPARARGALGVSDPEGGGGASGAGFAAGVGRRRRAVVETGEMSGEAESG